jgi:hypothetical protein
MSGEEVARQFAGRIEDRKLRKGYVMVEPSQDQNALPAIATADE